MLEQNKEQPWKETGATKHIGNYSLTDLSQTSNTINTQFWDETRQWARKLAHRVMDGKFAGNYWAEEFSDLAVAALWKAWTSHPELSGEPWFKFAKTVMVRTIMRYVIAEKKRDMLTDFLSTGENDESFHPSTDVLESRELNAEPTKSDYSVFDSLYDLNVDFADFFEKLTPSEKRVLPERVNNPSATSEEVAEWAGFPSGGSVRYHEMNYRSKAEDFIKKHPNKEDWQRYLVTKGRKSTKECGVSV